MGDIKALLEIDIFAFLMTLFVIISAIVTMATLVTKFAQVIGKPIKWFKKNDEQHDMILDNHNKINELADEQHKLEEKLNHTNELLLNLLIDDYRWKILDFASNLSKGNRKYNQEAFNHIFMIYEKYEKILEENNLENGLVEQSMDYIKHKYLEILQQGVQNYIDR